MNQTRSAFFISDGTGITAEGLGQSLLTQFESLDFDKHTIPYIDTIEKAQSTVERINRAAEIDGIKPLIFDTIVDRSIREVLSKCNGFMIDIFSSFLEPLEQELKISSSLSVGRTPITEDQDYKNRINAVNYALENDDGARTRYYNQADVILVGPSRSGKTPSCLYLALHYGIKAANYPITEEDMNDQRIPAALKPHKQKIFGLTIEPDRLALIRNERKPNSRYASIKQCNFEVEEVELMYRRERIDFLNTTHYSIEEIATRIMVRLGLERRG